jgi:hypothetical protein
MEEVKRKYLNIGTVKRKKKEQEDEPDRFYLELNQARDKDGKPLNGSDELFPITLANGMKLEAGDILTMFSKKLSFQRKVSEGAMEQEKADYLSSFMKYDVCVPIKDGTEAPKKKSKKTSEIDF